MKEQRCPQCRHPMMSGPLQPHRGQGDNRVADWYCADCHHIIWQQSDIAQPKEGKKK